MPPLQPHQPHQPLAPLLKVVSIPGVMAIAFGGAAMLVQWQPPMATTVPLEMVLEAPPWTTAPSPTAAVRRALHPDRAPGD